MWVQSIFKLNKIIMVTGLLSISLQSLGDSFIGQISGIDCGNHGHLCPLKKFEQHISQESQFVLLTSNKSILHLDSINRDTLLRYVSKRVIVIGELTKGDKRINVTELQVQQGEVLGHYESVWRQP